ncbi:MAG: hypothetical protein Tsb0020_02350 [Haliangiales bacterium]
MKRFNRAFSGAQRDARTMISRHMLARVRSIALILVAVMGLIWLIQGTGFFDRGDASLRSLYYDVQGTYAIESRVVFVAMDEHTGEAWGPVPWEWQRYYDLLGAIWAAKPQAIALLEPGPRVLPNTPPQFDAELAQAIASGRILLPSAQAGLAQPSLFLDRMRGVESVWLGPAKPQSDVGSTPTERLQDLPDKPTITRQLIRNTGLSLPSDSQSGSGYELWVHYLGGPDSLPTLSAHRVARGEIPPQTFADRIVIIGMRGEQFASRVPTPIGPLSPAEVHAYAVRGLAHDAVWTPMPTWAWIMLTASLALMCLVVLPFLGTRRAVLMLLVFAVALLAADYALFAMGLMRLGATAPLVTLGVAATAAWVHERRQILRELESLSRWSARYLTLEHAGRHEREAFDELWEQFARTSRTFTQFESTLLGELQDSRWHIHFERSLGISPDQVQEMRRDIRREPYKSAYLMHRPMWSEHFIDDELSQKTLLVPLTSFNRILGLWVINYRKGVEVPRSTLQMIEHLAEQLALTIERRRIRRLFDVRGKEREGVMLRPILETRTSVQFFAHEQSSLTQTFESLPVGILVATMWGETEYVNAAMRRFFTTLSVDGVEQRSLPDLITALTDATEQEVHDTVVRLFSGSPFVELACHSDITASYQVILSSLSAAPLMAEGDASVSPTTALSHLVLTVTRRADAADTDVRQSAVSGG